MNLPTYFSRHPIYFCAIFVALISTNIFGQQVKIRSQLTPACGTGNSKFSDITADGNIAVMGSYSCRGVFVFDISNPNSPVLSSHYNPTPNQQFLEAIVIGNRGYFGSGIGGEGVHIVDLSNPAAPQLLGKVNSAAGNGYNTIHEMMVIDQGGKRYLIENSNSFGVRQLKIVDVTIPSTPVFIRDLTPTEPIWIHAIHIRGNRMFTSGWGNSVNRARTEIYDISNLATTAPTLLGFIEDTSATTAGNNTHSSWTSEDGNYLYSAREISGTSANGPNPGDIRVYNISNPAVPLLIRKISMAELGLNAVTPHNPVVMGNKLYVSWYQAGLQVFDIGTDPTNPKRIGQYDTFPATFAPDTESRSREKVRAKITDEPWDIVCASPEFRSSLPTTYDGLWAVYPFLGENRVILADLTYGISIVDVSGLNGAPKNPISDYDGDKKSDLSNYSPLTGVWTVHNSSNNIQHSFVLGIPGDVPVPADYDGDDRTDAVVWRSSNGAWYRYNGIATELMTQLGTAGDIPVPGDFDADGKVDAAIFRPSTGTWHINQSLLGARTNVWGASGDKVATGDFDGDGKSDLVSWRPSTAVWNILLSSSSQSVVRTWGAQGDRPLITDFNGDGRAELTIFRPSTGIWYRKDVLTDAVTIGYLRHRGFIPIPADYDGDGKTDLAMFRLVDSSWLQLNSSTGDMTLSYFGQMGDQPLPIAYQLK